MAERYADTGRSSGKERLIHAARTLLEERTFDEMTVDEIIKKADLSRPSFYYHFAGGKEELRAELVSRGLLHDRPLQDTQAAILEAALNTFARSGVSATTLEEIATEAGVTRGTLCWHFHSKEDLLLAVVKHYSPHSMLCPAIDKIAQDMQDGVLVGDESIFRRIAGAFYDAFTATTHGDLTRLAILLVYTHPEPAQILADMIVKDRKRVTEYVQRRQIEGYFRDDINPSLFVQIIAAFFAMRAIGRGLSLFAQSTREELINQLVSLLLYGMVRRDQPLP
ncbi:MAG: helix-turn-helix transcriptional regulator [Ktedonobacteraceae bacterium]|nr:helix-turn-helix transcriptional regulator [Ktedonobacteraceae bacterium]